MEDKMLGRFFHFVLIQTLLVLSWGQNVSSDAIYASNENGSFLTSTESCLVLKRDHPIAQQDGDYIIAGVFNIGKTKTDKDGKKLRECSYDEIEVWNLQKALVFVLTVLKGQDQIRSLNKTVGYAVYDACNDESVTGRTALHIANNKKAVGVAGVDYKDLVKRSAGITTAAIIPTFTYLFNDQDLMTHELFPSLFSMLETQQVVGLSLLNFLREMNYTYIDVWYHEFSSQSAKIVYEGVCAKAGTGCGRINDTTNLDHSTIGERIDSTYRKSGGTPAKVQLILHNTRKTTEAILGYLLKDKKLENAIYIFGVSNGREKFISDYARILEEYGSGNDTIVTPLPTLLNVKLPKLSDRIAKPWRGNEAGLLDEIYSEAQGRKCKKTDDEGVMKCDITGWLAYVVAGVKVLMDGLYNALLKEKEGENDGVCDTVALHKFRHQIHRSIVDENKTMNVELEPGSSLDIRFKGKQLRVGIKLGVYQMRYPSRGIVTLGRMWDDKISITNETLKQEISHYEGACAKDCQPGFYKVLPSELKGLDCCWKCYPCETDYYTTGINENQCLECKAIETSNDNRTGCELTDYIHIKLLSPYFLAGAACSLLGVIVVVLMVVVISKNEDRAIIKASDPGYLYMVLVGLGLGFATTIVPLLEPADLSCTIEYFSILTFASFITVNLAWKCVKIYGIFAAANNFKKPRFGFLLNRVGQACLNIGCLVITLGFVFFDSVISKGTTWRYYQNQPLEHGPRYAQCATMTAPYPLLILPAILPPGCCFTLTLMLAFKMRNFPHNFRETFNISAATLVVLICCVMFLSGYTLADPFYTAILRAIVIWITCMAFLLCLFLPKIIHLLRTRDVDREAEKQKLAAAVRKFSEKDPKKTAGLAVPKRSSGKSSTQASKTAAKSSPSPLPKSRIIAAEGMTEGIRGSLAAKARQSREKAANNHLQSGDPVQTSASPRRKRMSRQARASMMQREESSVASVASTGEEEKKASPAAVASGDEKKEEVANVSLETPSSSNDVKNAQEEEVDALNVATTDATKEATTVITTDAKAAADVKVEVELI